MWKGQQRPGFWNVHEIKSKSIKGDRHCISGFSNSITVQLGGLIATAIASLAAIILVLGIRSLVTTFLGGVLVSVEYSVFTTLYDNASINVLLIEFKIYV